jgi:hypothetical protein
MKIQDLKVVYICPDHNEKYHKRKLHMDTMLSELGFKDVTHYKSGTEGYPVCLSKATVDILTTYMDTPILILEDDIEFTGVDDFDFVEDADVIYFGISRSAGHPSQNIDQGVVQFEPYSETQVRIKNMLTTHAILYISKSYKQSVIELLSNCMIYNDVALSRIQSSFKVLANKRPSFYQSNKYNTGDHLELYTNFQLIYTTLHIIATNKYIGFLKDLLYSVDKHYFPKTLRRIVLYTDSVSTIESSYPTLEIKVVPIVHEPWPFVTLKRFHYFSLNSIQSDYSFYCDVDSNFVRTLDMSLLDPAKLHGTIHPGWASTKGTVCTNEASTAYIPEGMNELYYCGGFFGGSHSLFMKMVLELKERIQTDMNNNVMAEWHDESHLNWYFWKNPPSNLHFPFAVQEFLPIFATTCLVFLDKSKRPGYLDIQQPPKPQPLPQRFKLTALGFKRY